MKRILESFKNLYRGSDVVKKHLMVALMFVIPGLLGATAQFADKEYKEILVPVLIAAVILLVLSIIPILFLSGFYIKFVNKRLVDGAEGIPAMDLDCLVQGLKLIPVYFVWSVYVGIPVGLYFFAVIAAFLCLMATKPETYVVILSTIVLFGLCFLLIIPLFIITPFIQQVYIKYAETLEYSKSVFNPLTPFRFMKRAFKESMLVALKFLIVSVVTSSIAQVFGFIIAMFIIVVMMFAIAFSHSSDPSKLPAWIIILLILISSLAGVIQGYVTQMTQLAYIDNLEDVYKEKLLEQSIADESPETQE